MIKRSIFAAALTLCASQAIALPGTPIRPDTGSPRDICGIEIPPARYERASKLPLDGPHYVSAAVVARECLRSGERFAVGCTNIIGLTDAKGFHAMAARMLIADAPTAGTNPACTPEMWRASILRHEMAHAAGWPANHPR